MPVPASCSIRLTRTGAPVTFARTAIARTAIAPLLILLALALAACGSAQPGAPITAAGSPAPVISAVARAPQASPTPTATLPSTQASSPTAVICANPAGAPTATPTAGPTLLPTPTATRVPANPPAAGPEAYRLKLWDESSALQAFEQAKTVPIPEEYEPMRSFYQVSLLYEAYLINPELRARPDLTRQMFLLKTGRGTYFSPYGLLHDHSVESFRQLLEAALNDGSAKIDSLETWLEALGGAFIYQPAEDWTRFSTHFFDTPSDSMVVRIRFSQGWDFFVIRPDSAGHFSVFAIYPEWEREWWSDDSFQVTDLNANGKDEIAITHDAWGTGFSHFCHRAFTLYEWNGSTFQDLMADPLEYTQGTDYGGCLAITFPPDPRGGKKIQAGTTLETLCKALPYEQPIRFAWDGQGYRQEAIPIPTPTLPTQPDRCTIDWAIKAGAENDTAVRLLEEALVNWPAEAEQEWGPAAQDYLRLKLATWQIRRGQLERGLDLLRQVRDHPIAPAFLPQKIAAAFLENYTAHDWYQAQQAVASLYVQAQEGVCGVPACNTDTMRQLWGFKEREWGIEMNGFHSDFAAIDALKLALQNDPPATLAELQTWLGRHQRKVTWSTEGDLDGQGPADWLVEIEHTYADAPRNHYYELLAFLRQDGAIRPVVIDDHYEVENNADHPRRWQSFRPDPFGPPENVFQAGAWLYAFRLVPQNGIVQLKLDLNSFYISLDKWYDRPVNVQDWRIANGRLLVQYEGRQAIYAWDAAQGKLVPTGFAPEGQEENVRQVEQALYIDRDPARALALLNGLLAGRIWEMRDWTRQTGDTYPPGLRPYVQYLLGLAYEHSGDPVSAARAYWQLWQDYPASPYSLAAQSKLEKTK